MLCSPYLYANTAMIQKQIFHVVPFCSYTTTTYLYIYIPYLVYDIPAAVLGLYNDGRRIARPIALGL